MNDAPANSTVGQDVVLASVILNATHVVDPRQCKSMQAVYGGQRCS